MVKLVLRPERNRWLQTTARWVLLSLLILHTLTLHTGCGSDELVSEPPLVTTHDLMQVLPSADWISEVGLLYPGAPESRRFLGSGWSRAETDPSGVGFAWGMGEASALELPVLALRDLELVLDGRPFISPGTLPQHLRLELGEALLGEVEMSPWRSEYRIAVPQEKLRAGKNRLRVVYSHHRSPEKSSAPSDRRALAVAWYRIGFEPELPTQPPQIDSEGSRLFVPFGTRLEAHLALRANSELRADSWTFRGGGGLEILTQKDGEEAKRIYLDQPPEDGRVPLPYSGIVRLALQPISGTETNGRGGVMITRPILRGAAEDTEQISAHDGPRAAPAEPPSPSPQLPKPQLPKPQLPKPQLPNIVLFLVDTLRADRLGVYGNPDGLTPHIDAFAESAVVFESSFSQSSWTRASIASILTGLWPPAHGTNRRDHVLSSEARLLPDILRNWGYQTAAFVSNPNISPTFGFDRGFDHFDLIGTGADGVLVVDKAIEWLESRRTSDRPLFLFLLTTDPHSPYAAPREWRQKFAPSVPFPVAPDSETLGRGSRRWAKDRPAPIAGFEVTLEDIEALYDAEVAFNDQAFGELLTALESIESDREAVIFFSSDHGEEFLEHGRIEHGKALFVESIQVPLIVRASPSKSGSRVDVPVQHLDWLPTILEVVGEDIPTQLTGRSLLPWLSRDDQTRDDRARRESWPEERPIFTYLHLDQQPRVAVQLGDWKLTQVILGDHFARSQLFHLPNDRGESTNLADTYPIRAAYLGALIRDRLNSRENHLDVSSTTIDDELRKTLEALGYL